MNPEKTNDAQSKTYLFDTLHDARKIITQEYQIKKISIQPVNIGVSRLSNPVKITGITKKGKKIHYFGKIIGYSDVFAFRSMQYLKNVFLQLHNQEPLFGVFETPEEMALNQYKMLKTIHMYGIPTAKPLGCHLLQNSVWLLIIEYLDATPLSSMKKIDAKQIDLVFSYVRKLHKKKIFHGDLKPDNIMIGKTVYLLDVGYIRPDASSGEKQAYDLASLLGSLLPYLSIQEIIQIAKKHYSQKTLQTAAKYIELVQMRPDIHFNDEMKERLLSYLHRPPKAYESHKKNSVV